MLNVRLDIEIEKLNVNAFREYDGYGLPSKSKLLKNFEVVREARVKNLCQIVGSNKLIRKSK